MPSDYIFLYREQPSVPTKPQDPYTQKLLAAVPGLKTGTWELLKPGPVVSAGEGFSEFALFD